MQSCNALTHSATPFSITASLLYQVDPVGSYQPGFWGLGLGGKGTYL